MVRARRGLQHVRFGIRYSSRVFAGLALPRFDTPVAVACNVVGMAIAIAATVLLVRHRRSGKSIWTLPWVLVLLHVSVRGIYLPFGPVILLGRLYSIRAAKHPIDSPEAPVTQLVPLDSEATS
jgi:hypothetical protein